MYLLKRPKHKEIIKNGSIMMEIRVLEISTVFQIWDWQNRNNLFTLMEEDFEFMTTSYYETCLHIKRNCISLHSSVLEPNGSDSKLLLPVHSFRGNNSGKLIVLLLLHPPPPPAVCLSLSFTHTHTHTFSTLITQYATNVGIH